MPNKEAVTDTKKEFIIDLIKGVPPNAIFTLLQKFCQDKLDNKVPPFISKLVLVLL